MARKDLKIGNRQIVKRYVGAKLVWENEKYLIAYTKYSYRPGEYTLYLNYQDQMSSIGNIYKIEAGGQTITGSFNLRFSGPEYEPYDTAKLDVSDYNISNYLTNNVPIKLFYK